MRHMKTKLKMAAVIAAGTITLALPVMASNAVIGHGSALLQADEPAAAPAPDSEVDAAPVDVADPVAPDDEFVEDRPEHELAKRKGRFPMDGAAFVAKLEKRLERVAARIEKRLERSDKSDEAKERIRRRFLAGAEKVRTAARDAAADGTVTREEAQRVRELAKRVRGKKGNKGRKGRKDRKDRKRRGARDNDES